jgi:hypothetical protein
MATRHEWLHYEVLYSERAARLRLTGPPPRRRRLRYDLARRGEWKSYVKMGLGLGGWCTFDQLQCLLALWIFERGDDPGLWLFDPRTGRRATVVVPLTKRWPSSLHVLGTVTAWGRVSIGRAIARLTQSRRVRRRQYGSGRKAP